MQKPTPEILRKALELYATADGRHHAFRLLKEECGMNLGEAREALADAAKTITKGEGTTSEDERAIEEAFGAVSTFDELTVMVLRHMRDTKDPIATEPMQGADVLKCCADICDAMRKLIRHDVNPTRAMTAFFTECLGAEDTKTLAQREQAMQNAIKTSLRDDLLTLL